jgi:hypothetical protein
MATLKNDWSTNVTHDPYYGAVPTVVTHDPYSTVTISDNTNSPGGYTIGGYNGATGANTVWTTTGTGTDTFTVSPNYSAIQSQSGKMSLRGDKADLDINGKSLKNWMEQVEERLNLLTPNPELEQEWDELRRLGERYRKLEKKCKEKAEVWNKLKSMPKPEVK